MLGSHKLFIDLDLADISHDRNFLSIDEDSSDD